MNLWSILGQVSHPINTLYDQCWSWTCKEMYRLPFSIKACQRVWQPWGDVNGSGVQNPLIIKKKPEWRTASLSARVWTNSVLIAFGDTTTWFWRRLNWNAFPKTVCSVVTRWNYGCGDTLMSRVLKKLCLHAGIQAKYNSCKEALNWTGCTKLVR